MIIRLTSDQLRKIADQLDAYTALENAGANHQSPNTVIAVDEKNLAYLQWRDIIGEYTAEFISFIPEDAEPLCYHETLRIKEGGEK